MILCLSVSVSSRSFIETDERVELVLGTGAPLAYYTLCSTEIRVPLKYASVHPEPYRLARYVADTQWRNTPVSCIIIIA